MPKLTLELFHDAASRFEKAEAEVQQAWKKGCHCPSPGERLECWTCPYYKNLGRLIQKKLHATPEKVFALIPPAVSVNPASDEVKEQCWEMYRNGYSIEEIQRLVGVKSRRTLRGWLREAGLLLTGTQYPEPLKQKCLQMYADRCTPSEIENETSVPADVVTDWAATAGISRKRKYSQETQQHCLALYSEGKSSTEIHQLTGIADKTIRAWIWKAGISRGQKRYSTREKQKCRTLYQQGKSPREIEELTGILQATIRSWKRKERWTRERELPEASVGTQPSTLGEAACLSSQRKPVGYWTDFEKLKSDILTLNAQLGQIGIMPKAAQLRQLGRYDLAMAISKYHGGYRSVASRLGLTYTGQRFGYWHDFANVESELQAFIEQQGTPGVMPSRQQLEQAGEKPLAAAIGLHGGVLAVARRLGLKLPYGRKPRGYWKNPDNLKSELVAVAVQLCTPGVMPTREQLVQIQRAELIGAIATNGGWPSVARRFGLAYSNKGYTS